MRLLAIALIILPLLAACSTYSDRVHQFRSHWSQHQWQLADGESSRLVAEAFDVEPEQVASTNGTADALIPASGDQALWLLDKAMAQLALGNLKAAKEILLRCDAVLQDQLRSNTARAMAAELQASLSDDNALPYRAPEYDLILVRVMLTLVDLQLGGRDAFAFTVQLLEAQEAILSADWQIEFGDGTPKYNPSEQYKRVGIGAYLQGIIHEANQRPGEARRNYTQFTTWEPDLPLSTEVKRRVDAGFNLTPGHGVLHVFYLGGFGPTLREVQEVANAQALKIAGVIAAFMTGTWSLAGQKGTIPIPAVQVNDPSVPGLNVDVADVQVATSTLLNVNAVAVQRMNAVKPIIMARAVIRRLVKAAIAATAEEVGKHQTRDNTSKALISIGALLANAISTSLERADTRSWGSVPAQFQTARVELAAGEHDVNLGDGSKVKVRIAPGRDSFVLVLRPNLNLPGVTLVDESSRVGK